MSEILMFNPNTLAQAFISASNKNDIERMQSDGWLSNPRLVDMYHSGLKKHEMVPVQNQKEWENKEYFAEPTMIYHPKEETRMVSAIEAKKVINSGWYLSPAHFPGNSEGKFKTTALKEAV